MKVIFSLLFLLALNYSVLAQPNRIDSLKLNLFNADSDTTIANSLISIARFYQESNRDSSLLYAEQIIEQAEKMKNPYVRVAGLLFKCYAQYHKTDIIPAFNSANEALKIIQSKEVENTKWFPRLRNKESHILNAKKEMQGIIYSQFAMIYTSTKNNSKILEYFWMSSEIASQENNYISLISNCMNISKVYYRLGNMDSSYYYSKKSLKYSIESGEEYFMGLIYANLGSIYFDKLSLDSARYYYLNGYSLATKSNFESGVSQNLIGLTQYYELKKDIDSMLICAKKAYQSALKIKLIPRSITALQFIAEAFKLKGNLDSAYYYLNTAKIISDSLSLEAEQKRMDFQSHNFEEQLKFEKATQDNITLRINIRTYALITGLCILTILVWIFYRNNLKKKRANLQLEAALENLKATQAQLIQSEKMASLGELTAGIAHEIQNPLNFVNNFSEINLELIEEYKNQHTLLTDLENQLLLQDISENTKKINQHGKRADTIVKGMLQHSRKSAGVKELTNLNALCDEYLKLAYHGIRAKDKSFHSKLDTSFDNSIDLVNLIPQDFGRVLLNLITNAFYAVHEKLQQSSPEKTFEPIVSITTSKKESTIEIIVADNGNGIPPHIIDKIFQPFFTTKPTGQGTGLGLSLAYDIIKGHGGKLKVETVQNEGSTFIIALPH